VSRFSHCPDRQLGQAEPRVFRGNDEVAGSGDRTERGAVDCAYDGHTASAMAKKASRTRHIRFRPFSGVIVANSSRSLPAQKCGPSP
jgi:hypothetical protein